MRTVSIFTNGNNQAVRLPKDMEFVGVKELEIIREGDRIILKPIRPSWITLAESDKADNDFMQDREAIVTDEGRIKL